MFRPRGIVFNLQIVEKVFTGDMVDRQKLFVLQTQLNSLWNGIFLLYNHSSRNRGTLQVVHYLRTSI
jgi:hypothetical protein